MLWPLTLWISYVLTTLKPFIGYRLIGEQFYAHACKLRHVFFPQQRKMVNSIVFFLVYWQHCIVHIYWVCNGTNSYSDGSVSKKIYLNILYGRHCFPPKLTFPFTTSIVIYIFVLRHHKF